MSGPSAWDRADDIASTVEAGCKVRQTLFMTHESSARILTPTTTTDSDMAARSTVRAKLGITTRDQRCSPRYQESRAYVHPPMCLSHIVTLILRCFDALRER